MRRTRVPRLLPPRQIWFMEVVIQDVNKVDRIQFPQKPWWMEGNDAQGSMQGKAVSENKSKVNGGPSASQKNWWVATEETKETYWGVLIPPRGKYSAAAYRGPVVGGRWRQSDAKLLYFTDPGADEQHRLSNQLLIPVFVRVHTRDVASDLGRNNNHNNKTFLHVYFMVVTQQEVRKSLTAEPADESERPGWAGWSRTGQIQVRWKQHDNLIHVFSRLLTWGNLFLCFHKIAMTRTTDSLHTLFRFMCVKKRGLPCFGYRRQPDLSSS